MDPTYLILDIFLPETHLPALQSALQEVDAGHIGNYDCCLSYSPAMSTWRPLPGNIAISRHRRSDQQRAGAEKAKVTIRAERFAETMEAIKKIHPYKEPVINAIPLWE